MLYLNEHLLSRVRLVFVLFLGHPVEQGYELNLATELESYGLANSI